MRFKPMIRSLLETDMYKLSMGQAIFHGRDEVMPFSEYTTTWTFKLRNKDVKFTPEMVEEIKEQWKNYCNLKFTAEEINYLKNSPNTLWIKNDYANFLKNWHPNFEEVVISDEAECGLSIEATGSWLDTSMYEIAILAIVNETYFRMAYDYEVLFESFKKKLEEKIESIGVKGKYSLSAFSEFGLRRRLSFEAQELAVKRLSETKFLNSTFVGTSNVYLAMKYNLKPVGTQAHEWIMCVGQGNHMHNPAYANWYALNAWVDEYGTLNGTALTDTITTDCFLKDFKLTFATLFSGVRHDSGDPIEWGEKMIRHYEILGLDPKLKTLLFSDSLDFEKADKIYKYFNGKAKIAFGIGTFIANDTDAEALNIVMKVTQCNGVDVAKISDTKGKGMCKNEEYVKALTKAIERRVGGIN